jgi:hypothetical protein
MSFASKGKRHKTDKIFIKHKRKKRKIPLWRIIVRFLKMFRRVGGFWPRQRAFASFWFQRHNKKPSRK